MQSEVSAYGEIIPLCFMDWVPKAILNYCGVNLFLITPEGPLSGSTDSWTPTNAGTQDLISEGHRKVLTVSM